MKNVKVRLSLIATGLFFTLFFGYFVFEYYSILNNGTHTIGTITHYNRIGANAKNNRPSFTYYNQNGIIQNGSCKTSLPNFLNNSAYRFFEKGDTIKVAYVNDKKVVIQHYTSWIFYLLYIFIGLFFLYVGVFKFKP